jgi:xanthine phosphoribosyltransferase
MRPDNPVGRSVTITWDKLHGDSLTLAVKLAGMGPFNGIIAVARGGLIPATIVAKQLDIRLIDTVCVMSYEDRGRRVGSPVVLKPVAGDGEGWLVIDDLVDSGETFIAVRALLPRAHFATLYAKPHGVPLVNTTVTLVDQDVWVVFPWENPTTRSSAES